MNLSILLVSIAAVAQVFVVCAAGALLARRGVLDATGRRVVSRLVFELLLPCLLFTKIVRSCQPGAVRELIILPLSACVYIVAGIALGFLAGWAGRPPSSFRRGVVAAAAFGNSGYLPMTLIAAVAASAPWLAGDEGAGARGIGYVSLYLIGYSILFWGTAFPWLAGGKPKLAQLFTPPTIAALTAVLAALILPVRHLLLDASVLRPVFLGAEMLGVAAIPGAMLLLGANLMDAPKGVASELRMTTAVAVARMICMPAIGIGWVLLLERWKYLPEDPVLRLVLLLEAATPSAMNLVVMCQVHGNGEAEMSRLVARMYGIGAITVTIAVSIHLKLVFGSS